MDIIYLDHNKRPHLLEVPDYATFANFVKTNIFDIVWAKLMNGNFLIDEYTNLSHLSSEKFELIFPPHLINAQYTILSKWNIEVFRDFIKAHFPEKVADFWIEPQQFSFNDVGIAFYDKQGRITSSTTNSNPKNRPVHPSDIIIVDSEYFKKQFSFIGNLVETKTQQDELIDIDRFTMFNVGV